MSQKKSKLTAQKLASALKENIKKRKLQSTQRMDDSDKNFSDHNDKLLKK